MLVWFKFNLPFPFGSNPSVCFVLYGFVQLSWIPVMPRGTRHMWKSLCFRRHHLTEGNLNLCREGPTQDLFDLSSYLEESPVNMYSPQSLHRWGITHSESMERLAYSQGKLTFAWMTFFSKCTWYNMLGTMLFTIYIIAQIHWFEQNSLNICSVMDIYCSVLLPQTNQ